MKTDIYKEDIRAWQGLNIDKGNIYEKKDNQDVNHVRT